MEVDITKKVNYIVKYGLAGLLVLALLCAGGVWFYQHHHAYLTVYDAKVTSTMVSTKARADGTVEELLVEDGAHVEAGDVIAHIKVNITDDQLQQLQQTVDLAKQNLEQLKAGSTVSQPSAAPAPVVRVPTDNSAARAEAAQARARLNRMNQLFEMGAISAVKRDQAEADYNAAEAAASSAPSVTVQSTPSASYHTSIQPTSPEVLKQAELQVKQAEAALETAKQDAQATDIVAPVAGTVYYTDTAVGSDVKAGQTIVNIGDAGNIWLEASVTRSQKDKARLGQFVSYVIDGHNLQGTILDIIDPQDAPQTEAAVPAADDQQTDDSAVQGSNGNHADNSDTGTAGKQKSTEGTQPATDPNKITIKISLPTTTDFTLRPGMKAVVKLSI